MDGSNIRSSRGGRRIAVSQRLGVDVMSRHVLCSALVVATLILAVCSSACVQAQGQDAHSPAAQALADLRATAEAGDASAQFILGGMYVTGVGVPQDDVEAVAWYRRAAEQGHARAQYNLGAMYAEGLGVPPDAAVAVAWYRRAAEQGDATAQNNLGAMYAEGLGVPPDAAAAVAWYRRAAEQGDATAQSNLGRMYDQGLGVPQDDVEAVAWYRRAAAQGDARAQYNLGGMYRESRGVPPDAAAAIAWYRRAAEQGHTRAQYNLGGMYAEGLGVPPDAVEAHMWLTIAAARATSAEREQMVTARTAVAVRMTPTDVREAERREQAWLAAHQGMRNRAAPPSDTGREGVIIALGLLFGLCCNCDRWRLVTRRDHEEGNPTGDVQVATHGAWADSVRRTLIPSVLALVPRCRSADPRARPGGGPHDHLALGPALRSRTGGAAAPSSQAHPHVLACR